MVALLVGILIGVNANNKSGELASAKAANATLRSQASQLTGQSSSLKQQQTALPRQQRQLKAQLGEVQASQISDDAIYVVGKDIKPGVYHTDGSGDTGASDCYFATLNSTDTSNIADNNNFDGPETVDVSSAYAFEINGPCTWSRVG